MSDKDNVFTRKFREELIQLCGSKLSLSSAHLPQSGGQTEVVNRTLEMYLRYVVGERPKDWVRWLPWVEYCYNTCYHSSLPTTPFKLVDGCDPPRVFSYIPGTSKVDAVDIELCARDQLLAEACDKLLLAQTRMKRVYDDGHCEVHFEVGDWVWLRLHPYCQQTLANKCFHKLLPKFFGPFQVAAKVGTVANQLLLPADVKLHSVLHVSLLKPFKGTPPQQIPSLPPLVYGRMLVVLSQTVHSHLNRGLWEVLVQWADQSLDDANWEHLGEFWQLYPSFELMDKLIFGGRE